MTSRLNQTDQKPQIPVANPMLGYTAHRAEIDAALQRVLSSGNYILGPEVRRFEEGFARYLGLEHAAGVASGTDALTLALRALGVQSGDQVITTAHTAVATVAAIELAGAEAVLCDIENESLGLDPLKLPELITPRTKAIVAVHIYGQPCDMRGIMAVAEAHGLAVVEDCAQAVGACIDGKRCGTFGAAAAFSFYPTKNLGALGDGGMVVSSSADIAARVKELRQYGWRARYISATAGFNSRLDELQAAILNVKLPHLDQENERRRQIAARFSGACDPHSITSPRSVPGTSPCFHLYVVRVQERDRFGAFCEERGIGSAQHYPVPIHKQPAYQGRLPGADDLPNTERLYREIVTLPLYPELGRDEVERIAAALRAWRRPES
jgi:dTDP-4-amino-4,6-dideoxygalactose transaminase